MPIIRLVTGFEEDGLPLTENTEFKEIPANIMRWGWDAANLENIYAIPELSFENQSKYESMVDDKKAGFESELAALALDNEEIFKHTLNKIGNAIATYLENSLITNELREQAGAIFKEEFSFLGENKNDNQTTLKKAIHLLRHGDKIDLMFLSYNSALKIYAQVLQGNQMSAFKTMYTLFNQPSIPQQSSFAAESFMSLFALGNVQDLSNEEFKEFVFCCMANMVSSDAQHIDEVYSVAALANPDYKTGRYDDIIPNIFKTLPAFQELLRDYPDIVYDSSFWPPIEDINDLSNNTAQSNNSDVGKKRKINRKNENYPEDEKFTNLNLQSPSNSSPQNNNLGMEMGNDISQAFEAKHNQASSQRTDRGFVLPEAGDLNNGGREESSQPNWSRQNDNLVMGNDNSQAFEAKYNQASSQRTDRGFVLPEAEDLNNGRREDSSVSDLNDNFNNINLNQNSSNHTDLNNNFNNINLNQNPAYDTDLNNHFNNINVNQESSIKLVRDNFNENLFKMYVLNHSISVNQSNVAMQRSASPNPQESLMDDKNATGMPYRENNSNSGQENLMDDKNATGIPFRENNSSQATETSSITDQENLMEDQTHRELRYIDGKPIVLDDEFYQNLYATVLTLQACGLEKRFRSGVITIDDLQVMIDEVNIPSYLNDTRPNTIDIDEVRRNPIDINENRPNTIDINAVPQNTTATNESRSKTPLNQNLVEIIKALSPKPQEPSKIRPEVKNDKEDRNINNLRVKIPSPKINNQQNANYDDFDFELRTPKDQKTPNLFSNKQKPTQSNRPGSPSDRNKPKK